MIAQVSPLQRIRRAVSMIAVAGVALALIAACSDREEPEGPLGGATTSPRPDATTEVASTPDVETTGSGELSATVLASNLVTPWDIEELDDGRALISSRDTGELLVITPEGNIDTVGMIADTVPTREGGLLGLALSEDETELFAYVSTAEDNRVLAMSWDGTSLGAPTVILSGIPNEDTHNGGGLMLGPDGFLYVSTGDAREPSLSQSLDSLNGKILRMTTSGAPAPDNPFGTLVYSYGHRNVQGLAFDDDGRLWASEYGSDEWDELNLIEPGGNYGWPHVEGFGDSDSDFLDPQVTWRTDDASPAGLAFWKEALWMPALQGEALWEIPLDGGQPGDPVPHLVGEYGRLRSVTVTADGASMLLGTSNTDGRGDPDSDDDRILTVGSD